MIALRSGAIRDSFQGRYRFYGDASSSEYLSAIVNAVEL